MKRFGKRFGIMLLIIGLTATYASAAGELKWFSLNDGLEKAKTDKKPLIVDFFYGKGCSRCEFLQREVYDNPSIAKKIMDDFIPIRVDLSKKLTAEEEKFGNKYEFKNDCLLLFLDNEGNVLTEGKKRLCFIDKVDPEEFIKYLDMIKASYKKS